jgi:hypothetical protein
MVSAHTLPITLSNVSWLALSRAGVQSKFDTLAPRKEEYLLAAFRCLAHSKNLDDARQFCKPRSQGHTEALMEGLELRELWEEYGLVGDVVVRLVSIYISADTNS